MQDHDLSPQELSPKYLADIIKQIEEIEANIKEEEGKKKTRPAHIKFYCWIIGFVIFNGILTGCSFEVGIFKFTGIKEWGGSLSLLLPELIFLFIYGARSNIKHLELFFDKLVSMKSQS